MAKAVELVGAAQAAELRAALRECSDDIGDLVFSELEDIAKTIVADVRGRVPRVTGAAAGSYRARAGGIIFGGPDVPYVPWLEFGGAVGGKKATIRPRVKGGRYLYPTIAENFADIEKRVDDLIGIATGGYLEVE
jgi:hypothetical protein